MENDKINDALNYTNDLDANEKRNTFLKILQEKGISPDSYTQKNISDYKFKSKTTIQWFMDTLEISTIEGSYSSILWVKQDGSSHGMCGINCIF